MTKRTTRWIGLTMVVFAGGHVLTGCAEKGKGEGTRDRLPKFADRGTIQDDGSKTQNPSPPSGGDPADREPGAMSPVSRKILADCFGLDENEVAQVVGWTDTATSRDAANNLCTLLAKVGYNKGVGASTTLIAVDLDK